MAPCRCRVEHVPITYEDVREESRGDGLTAGPVYRASIVRCALHAAASDLLAIVQKLVGEMPEGVRTGSCFYCGADFEVVNQARAAIKKATEA